MKNSIFCVGILLFLLVPQAQAGGDSERVQGPCYRVNIQNDRVNQTDVRQDCDMNFSRTVQAGTENRASTIQTGDVNSNKVRQYQYEYPTYPGYGGGD